MSKQLFELLFEVLKEIDPNEFNMVYSSPNGMTVLKSSEYYSRLKQINDLKQDNARLQQRIDKALFELDTYRIDFDFPSSVDVTIEKARQSLRGNNINKNGGVKHDTKC